MVANTVPPPRKSPITYLSTPIYDEKGMVVGANLHNNHTEISGPKGQNGDHVTGHCSGSYSIVGGYNNTILPPKTLEDSKAVERLNNHPTFNKIKGLYVEALKVEMRKRGHSESSRIKSRWGTELDIIEEFIIKGKKLPENTDKALDRVCDELLKCIKSAGEYIETTNSYIDIGTMIDVMLHPAK